MPKNTKKTTGWNGVRRVLGAWDKPALLGLIKDLYAASEITDVVSELDAEFGTGGSASFE